MIKNKETALANVYNHKDIGDFIVGEYFTEKPKTKTIHKVNITCKISGWKGAVNCFQLPHHLISPLHKKALKKKAVSDRKREYEKEYEDFIKEEIEKARLKYNNYYDYSKFNPKKPHQKGIIICPKHGEHKQSISDHVNYMGCRNCLLESLGIKKVQNLEQMLIVLKAIHGDKLDFSNFKVSSAKEHGRVKCNSCGKEINTDFNHLSSPTPTGCDVCSRVQAGEKQKLSQEKVLSKLNNIYNGSLLFDYFIYDKAKLDALVYCAECDKFFYSSYDKLTRIGVAKGCPFCKGRDRTQEEAIFNLETYADNKLDFSEFIYTTSDGKSWVTCKECGNRWEASYILLIKGRSCGNCKSSLGEQAVQNILKKYNIQHQPQKAIHECRDILPLPFDFYIPQVDLLVEVQGIQHYEAIDFFGGEEGLKDRQKKDKIKKDYAEKHHNFLEIPYWEFDNIEQIILEKIKQLKEKEN